MTTAEELYERLRKVNEPKGYFFNVDHQTTMGLIEGLEGYIYPDWRHESG
jgi:ferredoxin-thioredoxin reductase catalytic subunit